MIVQGFWLGQSISAVEFLSYSSFVEHGFEYHLYSYGPISGLPHGVILHDASAIVPETWLQRHKTGSLALCSDLFRYCLLHQKGGIYVDSDIVCLKPFVPPKNKAAGELQKHTQNLVASTQYLNFDTQHPFMGEAVKTVKSLDLVNVEFTTTGPTLMQKLLPADYVLPAMAFNPNPWWEWEKALQPAQGDWFWSLYDNPDVYGVHLWNEMFRRNSVKKNCFPSGCFLDRLLIRYG